MYNKRKKVGLIMYVISLVRSDGVTVYLRSLSRFGFTRYPELAKKFATVDEADRYRLFNLKNSVRLSRCVDVYGIDRFVIRSVLVLHEVYL